MRPIQFINTFALSLAAFSTAFPTANRAQNATLKSVVPFGGVIDRCTVPGTVALTFDDGPYIYTSQLLDILSANGARATFFLNGQAQGSISAYPGVVQRALAEGHQIASHTYVSWLHFTFNCPVESL